MAAGSAQAHLGTKPGQVSPGRLRPLPPHKMDAEDMEPLLKKLECNSTRIIILRLSFVLRGLKHEPLEWHILTHGPMKPNTHGTRRVVCLRYRFLVQKKKNSYASRRTLVVDLWVLTLWII